MVKLLHIGIEACNDKWIAKELSRRTKYAEIKPQEEDVRIRALFDQHQPDCVFMQLQQANMINIGLIEYMSKKAILINWSGDVRNELFQWYVDFDKYCVSCFSNMRDVEEIGGEYLQIGFQDDIFNNVKKQKSIDIIFMANQSMGFPLSEYRIEVADVLRTNYKGFELYGGWPGSNGNLMKNQYAEAEYYRASKIAISVSHFNIDRYFSDRLIRSMGSGCFTLSHHYEGIEKDFEVKKHLDTFHDTDELIEKIDYYLENEKEREKIALAGYKHVHKNFTTKNMVNDILRIYTKYKNK